MKKLSNKITVIKNYLYINILRKFSSMKCFKGFISIFRLHLTSRRALVFHEVYNILLTLKHTNNNWIEVFRYVLNRKIATRWRGQYKCEAMKC